MHFEPLTIRAYLGTPYVGDVTCPIDGLLLSLACADYYGAIDVQIPGQVLDFAPQLCPIEIIENDAEWFYAASFAQWAEYTEGRDYWNKRLDDKYDTLTTAASVTIGAGAYKAYHSAFNYRHSPSIAWFVMGDKSIIEHLLGDCHFIGKKAAHGWGHVLRWEVQKIATNYSIHNEQDKLMRCIPMSYALKTFGGIPIDMKFGLRAYRPPYWDNHNMGHVLVP